jgi:transcriptional regulator with XRE-family HTH domain
VSNVLQLEVPMFPSAFANYRAQIRQPQPATMWAIARVLGVPGRDLFPLDLEEGS